MLRSLWHNFIQPTLKRPPSFQVAALCYRRKGHKLEILLITSRETRRWILPKGWPMPGLDAGAAAVCEAWEEAGVKPAGRPVELGGYRYMKRLEGGLPIDTTVAVFAVEVAGLHDDFPERHERARRWFTPDKAALRVSEPGLKALLAGFPDSHGKDPKLAGHKSGRARMGDKT